MDSKSGKQRTSEKGADDADDKIADYAKPSALNNLARKPASDEADEQDHKEAFVGHVHFRSPNGRMRG